MEFENKFLLFGIIGLTVYLGIILTIIYFIYEILAHFGVF